MHSLMEKMWRRGVLLGLIFIPFFAYWQLAGAILTTTQALFSVCLLVWGIDVLLRGRWRLPLLAPLLCFGLVLVVSVLQAGSRAIAAREALQMLWLVGLYWMFCSWCASSDQVKKGLTVLASVGLVASILALRQYFWADTAAPFLIHVHRARANFPLEHPNTFANYLAPLIFVSWGLFMLAQTRWVRGLWGGAFFVMAFTVFATYSRAAVLGVLAGTLVMAWGTWHTWPLRRDFFLGAAGLVVAFLALQADVQWSRPHPTASFQQRWEQPHRLQLLARASAAEHTQQQQEAPPHLQLGQRASDAERMLLLQVAWRMFVEHPWVGVGMGNFEYYWPRYAPTDVRESVDLRHRFAHFLPLHVAAELGIVGLVTVVWLFLALVAAVWRTLQAASAPGNHVLAWASAAALAASLGMGVLGWPFIRGCQEVLVFIAAVCTASAFPGMASSAQQHLGNESAQETTP